MGVERISHEDMKGYVVALFRKHGYSESDGSNIYEKTRVLLEKYHNQKILAERFGVSKTRLRKFLQAIGLTDLVFEGNKFKRKEAA